MTKYEINQFFSTDIADADPAIAAVITGELGRQRDEIELIASENIVSRAVLQAQGSVLTNKYAEGYPGRRDYGGCQFVDIVEEIAIARAKPTRREMLEFAGLATALDCCARGSTPLENHGRTKEVVGGSN
jgi:hypothetical protein